MDQNISFSNALSLSKLAKAFLSSFSLLSIALFLSSLHQSFPKFLHPISSFRLCFLMNLLNSRKLGFWLISSFLLSWMGPKVRVWVGQEAKAFN
jgi:hypothetical protein